MVTTAAPTSNGLQEANNLVRAIHHQITCADAPINNLSEIQGLLGGNDSSDKLTPSPECNDNLSSTASEHSFNSSVGPPNIIKKHNMLPPRPPKECNSFSNIEDAAAYVTGTASLANLCKRTEESVKGLNNGIDSFSTLPPLDGEIRPFDPTPRRSNGGSSVTGLNLPQSEGLSGQSNAHNNNNNNEDSSQINGYFDENIGEFSQFKQEVHKKSTPNKASEPSQQKPRMQMFASEYARILSSSIHNHSTFVSPTRSRLPPNMGVSSKLKAKLSRADQDASAGGIATLDDCPPQVASAAITDLIVTAGSDSPPRGYYRAFPLEPPEKNIGPTRKKSKRLYLNAKKEVNWDRAVQRPCVTAICVIYPERNEFVPPGFSVVRIFGGQQSMKDTENSEFGSSLAPANINPSSSGERIYLCYRRSREGNPITGILCLKPTRGDIIPDGYTVLEKTPRNYVADLSAKAADHPMFLAYRQRLENLECLRPLPLVLAVMHSRPDITGRKEMKAYYCTGGTTVSSDVGNLHIMDRSTHNLLSSSSAQSRLTMIQLSRKESGSAVPHWGSSASSHSSFQSNSQRKPESSKTNFGDGSSVSSHPDIKCDSTSISTFETPIESTVTRSPSHESLSSFGTAATSQGSPAMSFKRTTPRFNKVFSHSDDTLQSCFDAMNFIPAIECAKSTKVGDSPFLQSRVTVITPILTACYTSQGGSALVAVEGLTSLLNDTLFFEPDISTEDEDVTLDTGAVEASTRLTLLDLAVQVVCDVATSSARETYFRSCVDFVSDAVRYAGGKLNDRTIGYVLRFYLFVFYFGASIPSSGWPFDKDKNQSKSRMPDEFILPVVKPSNEQTPSLIGVYLPGGAPQAAAIALEEMMSIILGKLGDEMRCQKSKAIIIDDSTNKIDVANLTQITQLASYQIHRSGGSELFWHDMINSCGIRLFGHDTLSAPSVVHANIISFAILTSFVKISSGKVRVISNNSEPVPRDVASKLLSLELLLCFIEKWKDSICKEQDIDENTYDPSSPASTMVYVMRRLITPALLSNTASALEDSRVFRRVLRIISMFWSNQYYRSQMKIDLAVLMEHFVLRSLCLGPQVNRAENRKSADEEVSANADMPSLLDQQLDVLSIAEKWFSSVHTEIIDFYLKFDLGHDGSLPVTYCNVCTKIVEALCNLAEKCSAIICEHSRFTSINGPNSSPRKGVISPRASGVTDMAHVRDTAQLLREKSFLVITIISKSMMRCASIKHNPQSPVKKRLASDNTIQPVSYGVSPQLSPAPDVRMIDDNNIIDYWHTSIERRKAPLQIFHQLSKHSQDSESTQSNSIKNSRSEDSSKYSISQHKKEVLDIAFDLIANKGMKKGIDYLIASHVLTSSPREVSSFLRVHQSSIDPDILGEYLGEGGIDGSDKDYWNHIRFNYARAVSFVGMNIEQGLRHFLTGCGFRLPGEAQKIDRIISTFSQCYWEDNAGDLAACPFPDQDTVFLVSFAIIMLNTDLHKASVGPKGRAPKKMSRNEFITNLRHVYNSVDKFREYLIFIYDSIEALPIAISNTGTSTQKNLRFEHSSPSLPFRDDSDFASSIQAWVRGVKRAQELLRTVAVQHEEVLISSELKDESVLLELTYEMFSSTWHLFYGLINTTIDNAYIDLAGLDCCVDLLEYSLCTATFLEMPLERSAFNKLLGRVNRFNELKVSNDDAESVASKNIDVSQIGFDELNEVRGLTQRMHTSLYVDDTKTDAMKKAAARIRNGEILLNDPSRTFVREGDLTKKHQLAGRSSAYRFFLFSDVLVYAHKSAQGDYKVHEELPLHLMKVEDFEGSAVSNKAKKSSFQIHHPNKSFLVVASNPTEKAWWVNDIRNSINKEVKRKARMEGARKAASVSDK